MEYLPTFTINKTTSHVGKYPVRPMDLIGVIASSQVGVPVELFLLKQLGPLDFAGAANDTDLQRGHQLLSTGSTNPNCSLGNK